MKILSVKRKSRYYHFNMETTSKDTNVYLTIFGVRLFRIARKFLCVKSQYQKNIELQNEEYREFQRSFINHLIMKKLLIIALLFSVCSCNLKHKHIKHVKIHSAKVMRHHDASDDDNMTAFVYWYWMLNSDGSCYSYSSSSPMTSFSSVTWSSSGSSPLSGIDAKEFDVQEMPEQTISEADLSADMQEAIDANPDNFEGMSEDAMGDYEGTDNSSDDAGSGDSGGDSGGGDSGGGDGGGSGD